MFKKLMFIFSFLWASLSYAEIDQDQLLWISLGSDAASSASKKFGLRFDLIKSDSDISVAQIDESMVPWLSRMMHREFNRCGGFMVHYELEEAIFTAGDEGTRKWAENFVFTRYQINAAQQVERAHQLARADRIVEVIEEFSHFHNRYFTSQTGVEAMSWLKRQWEAIASHRSDVSVQYWQHDRWPQPSVMATIVGTHYPDEIIVVGGHADSIAGRWAPAGRRAPGADDNASGVASMTEVMQVLMEKSFAPKRTIKFIAYAAEEVGLRGSGEIANHFRDQNKNVIGVLQLDMTNYRANQYDMVLISDFTNAQQNEFLASLLATYQPDVEWAYSRCGYACSDHASWHRAGFPVSFPFEAPIRQSNPRIHTADDVLENSDPQGLQALKFVKLALSYVIELN